MQRQFTLEELLALARVGEQVPEEEIAASRRRIERDLAASVWQQALSFESSAQHANTWLNGGAGTAARARYRTDLGAALHSQAGHDLNAMSTLVIRDSRAAQHIARMASPGRVEPEAALVFACLLHLARRAEAAQFWWQFSAGAGNTTAALCLYLMHLQRGELRDADHWAAQAAVLERLDPGGDQRPGRLRVHLISCTGRWSRPAWMVTRTLTELSGVRTPGSGAGRPGAGGASGAAGATGHMSCSLTAAVQRLHADCDEDYGEIPRPDLELAAQLEDRCAGRR
jgi:hypothetical protein